MRYATASVELNPVHRFSDPDYAALAVRLHSPRDCWETRAADPA